MNSLSELNPIAIRFILYAIDQSFVFIDCILLLLIIFKVQLKDKKVILWILPIIIIASAIVSILSGNDKFGDIQTAFLFLIPFIEILIVLKKPPILKCFAVVFAYGIIEDSVKYVLGIFIPSDPETKELIEIEIELCIDLLFFIIFGILYITVYNKSNLSEKLTYLDSATFIWVCATVIVFILTIAVLKVDYKDSKYSWIIIVNILMFSSLIPYIISSMLKAKEAEAYFRRALDTEIRHFEEINEKDADLRRFRHDYANHMICISAMIEDEQTDEVKQYVEKLGIDLQSTARDFYTGNYILDIIMSEKKTLAGRDGNTISFEGNFPKSGISNDDVCTIMANALDNAIEACRNSDKSCEIKVNSIFKDNQLSVSITNPVKDNLYIIGNSVATTKLDKAHHGFGIKSIKKAVAKYDGITQLSSDNKKFELFFTLKCK